MFLFGKKKQKDTAPKPKAMPYTKKVQFVYKPPKDMHNMLERDLNEILDLEPVNYYADKRKYYQFVFYYNEDYSEIYLQPELYENDIKTKSFNVYSIDKELYKKILLKFGQRVNI